MPFDQNQSDAVVRPQLARGEEGGLLSRRLTHIGLLQLVHFIKRGSNLLYSRISGLSDFEWRVLARVCDMPGLSINELGVVMDRSVAHVSRTVTRLVALGLVRREEVGGGRRVAIDPTPAGEQAYAPLIEVAVQSDRELTGGLTDEELKTLHRAIALMGENARARLAREQALSSARPGPAD